MASTDTILVGNRCELFMGSTSSDLTLANIKGVTGSNDANKIVNLITVDMPLGWEKEKIELSILGEQYKSFVFGQNNLIELTFSFYLNFNDDIHKAILDSETSGSNSNAEAWAGTKRGFLARYTQDTSKINYTYFEGYLQSAKIITASGDANTVETTVAVDGRMYTIAEA